MTVLKGKGVYRAETACQFDGKSATILIVDLSFYVILQTKRLFIQKDTFEDFDGYFLAISVKKKKINA